MKPWDLRLFSTDTSDGQFGPFAPLVALWHAKRRGRALPSWRDFDFDDFRGWHGWIAVEDVQYEPFDLKMRLWGSQLAELYGFELTNHLLSQRRDLRGITPADFDFLETVCRVPKFGLSAGTIDWRGREFIAVRKLFLPCAATGTMADTLVSSCSHTRNRPRAAA